MSENITHTGVVDDCLRLMLASDKICGPFKKSALKHLDMAHLGCMTRSGDRCNPGLLDTFRNRWKEQKPEDHLPAKLAFVLGWLCHRAADRQMKPIFRRFHPTVNHEETPTECSIYHDAFVFKTVYAGGKEYPYHNAMFGDLFTELKKSLNIDNIQTLVHILLRRSLIEMHTLIPDVENTENWIDQLYLRKQDYYVNLQQYNEVITHPDPDKVYLYIEQDNFYDSTDPIISVSRKLQKGKPVSADEVFQATRQKAYSHYAQALATGYGYLQSASDFFSTEMTLETLKSRLDIGKLGRDGIAV